MSINLFKRIAKELKKYDRFFEQRRNAAGKLGHSTEQKVTDALCMLVYGIPADLVDDHFFFARIVDDHLAMSESQAMGEIPAGRRVVDREWPSLIISHL
jgi:hypothetical protein